MQGFQSQGMRNDFSLRMGLLPNTFDRDAIVFLRPHTVKKCSKDASYGVRSRARR